MLFAQADALNIFDRYGVSVGMLGLFVLATVWIGRRLLNEKNGLLTFYVKQSIHTMQGIGDTCQQNADTQSRLADLHAQTVDHLKSIDEKQDTVLESIKEVKRNNNS